ncbi:hypothetical protein ABW19_dt0207326 [Dactylella cylindrospora]|nr:hypothetical protein ABW19_dt0207326 [Dactylella cylindrospora]
MKIHVPATSHLCCTEPRSQGSLLSIPQDGWSIGSPALSITSVDPESPSLRFKDCTNATAPRAKDEEDDRVADLREKASNYLQYIESLSQAYESQLKALCAFFRSREEGQTDTYMDEPSVEVVEVESDGSRRLIGIDDVDTLVEYFCEKEPQDVGNRVVSKAFLIERLTADIIGVFGAKLGVEPQFWDAHLNLADMTSTGSGQLVRFGSERGSRVSFLNIPLLRRCPSLENIEGLPQGKGADGNPKGVYEGCSVHLDYSTSVAESSNRKF